MEIKEIRKLQNGSDVRGIAIEGVTGEAVNFTQDMAMKIAYSFALWLSKKLASTWPRQRRLAWLVVAQRFISAELQPHRPCL
jgi:hypothetical protein